MVHPAGIQALLIEQDYAGRYLHGMTITDRRKADCWALGRQYELHTQVGKATKPRLKAAMEEMVWVYFANFADEYYPTRGIVEVLGADVIGNIRADAFREREAHGLPVPA